jgi:hypothetical protein
MLVHVNDTLIVPDHYTLPTGQRPDEFYGMLFPTAGHSYAALSHLERIDNPKFKPNVLLRGRNVFTLKRAGKVYLIENHSSINAVKIQYQ